MRKIILLALVGVVALSACGCFSRDIRHSKYHYRTFEEDLEDVHRDLELLFMRPHEVEAPLTY
jgi:hypothetical protein